LVNITSCCASAVHSSGVARPLQAVALTDANLPCATPSRKSHFLQIQTCPPFLRLSPGTPFRRRYRYQHIYGFFGLTFKLAHVVEDTDYLLPEAEGAMKHTWLVHQRMNTSSFPPRNLLLSWHVGGLNYQIEHHLFPKVCSVHYPAVSRVVRQAAAAHGVPYHEQPTLRQAIRSHYRMLKHFGRKAGSDASGKQGVKICAPPCRPPANAAVSPMPHS
jgi:fatty acid desaturase